MNFSQLIQFQAVAESENMTRAAEKLYISQPALTKSIRKFEEEMNTSLFTRQGKNIELNENGKIALGYVNSILKMTENMKLALCQNDVGQQNICIGSNLGNVSRYVVPLFQLEHEKIHLHMKEENLELVGPELLTEKMLDVVISYKPILGDERVCCELLFEDEIYVNVSPNNPLSDRESLSIEEVAQLSVLLPVSSRNNIYICMLNEALEKRGLSLNYIYVQDIGAMEYFQSITDNCSITSQFTLAFYHSPNRKEIVISEKELKIPYYISYLRNNYLQVRPFLDWLKERVLSKLCAI